MTVVSYGRSHIVDNLSYNESPSIVRIENLLSTVEHFGRHDLPNSMWESQCMLKWHALIVYCTYSCFSSLLYTSFRVMSVKPKRVVWLARVNFSIRKSFRFLHFLTKQPCKLQSILLAGNIKFKMKFGKIWTCEIKWYYGIYIKSSRLV